jgi:hypothetical protein
VGALIANLTDLGCAEPERDAEVTDPDGRVVAVADAFWRDGLQPGQGEPVVLALDPHLDLPQLEKLGHTVFVSTDALRSFVKRRNQEAAGEESTDEAVTA